MLEIFITAVSKQDGKECAHYRTHAEPGNAATVAVSAWQTAKQFGVKKPGVLIEVIYNGRMLSDTIRPALGLNKPGSIEGRASKFVRKSLKKLGVPLERPQEGFSNG